MNSLGEVTGKKCGQSKAKLERCGRAKDEETLGNLTNNGRRSRREDGEMGEEVQGKRMD